MCARIERSSLVLLRADRGAECVAAGSLRAEETSREAQEDGATVPSGFSLGLKETELTSLTYHTEYPAFV